jgi:hyperosmotically inducible periplasmic protein
MMHDCCFNRTIRTLLLSSVCSLIALPAIAQTPADNTKVNERDRAKGAVTADQQKETAGDRALAKKIRQSLMNDKSLSMYAHNIKIVARGGQVTLKGPVRSEDEKASIETKATEIAGAGHVTNQISVAPDATHNPPAR